MPAFLALTAAFCWGVGDFILGTQARRSPVLAVALVGQLSGFVAISVLVAARGTGPPPLDLILVGVTVGVLGAAVFCGIVGALAMGNMARVAPVLGMSSVIPVAFGLAQGEQPATLQMVGIVIAILGVVFVSLEEAAEESGHHGDRGERAPTAEKFRGRGGTRTALVIALLSAIGMGVILVGLNLTAEHDPFWATLILRGAGSATLAAAAAAFMLAGRFDPGNLSLSLLPLVSFGVLDTLANAIWAIASTSGLLSIAAVLGGIFPAVTVLLALVILKERLSRIQAVGVTFTIAGTAMITAG